MPTLILWLYAAAFGVVAGMSPEGELAWRVDAISRVTFPLIMAAWVSADAQKRQRRLCHDYDSFVFFAWPILVPVYLAQTRGKRAFLTLLCFAGIWLMVVLVAIVTSLIREFMFT